MDWLTKIRQWATPKRLFLWLVVYPGIPPAIATLGLVVYANWPTDVGDFQLPEIAKNTTHITIITHGKDDSDKTWAKDMASAFSSHSPTTTQALTIDWSDYSNNIMRCSLNGRRIGRHLGQQLAEYKNIVSVHVIGHSAGAFLTYGFCEAVKNANPSIMVQTTYLDPLGPYGIVFWNFGPDRFGDCADFSDAYINVGDGVPGSDVAIKNAHTFDVSNARITAAYEQNPHVWPVEYYLNEVRNKRQLSNVNSDSLKQTYAPGRTTKR